MTSYHIEIGYNGALTGDTSALWPALKAAAVKIAGDPASIAAEARRLGAAESDEGISLEDFANEYAIGTINERPNPLTIDEESKQVIQWACTSVPLKYQVRRAFVRLLVEAMHRQRIEVNVRVG